MSWLKIEDGSLVNLDHIVAVEVIDLSKEYIEYLRSEIEKIEQNLKDKKSQVNNLIKMMNNTADSTRLDFMKFTKDTLSKEIDQFSIEIKVHKRHLKNEVKKYIEKYMVLLCPSDDDQEKLLACIGSKSKCEDYMNALFEWMDGKEICAVGEHRCSCECGCQAMIREDFEFCDECSEAFHLQDYHEHLDELKKDAA